MIKQMDDKTKTLLLKYQKREMTLSKIYESISKGEKSEENQIILTSFAQEELEHANYFKQYTNTENKHNKFMLFLYSIINKILGYTFTIKLMNKHEKDIIEEYRHLEDVLPDIDEVIHDLEERHKIIDSLLDEDKLKFIGAIVLGLNDALVELTGTIAGLTFVLMNTRLTALSGIVTGISATLSMAASNYLAERADGNPEALKSSVYTGVAYLITVILMVTPYLIFPNHMYVQALVLMIIIVITIIFLFNYYISIAKSESFKRNFLTMASISLGVALIAFLIGIIAKRFLGIDV